LSKTEAGWLVGSFFAAYVVMVPLLVALTDRVPPDAVSVPPQITPDGED